MSGSSASGGPLAVPARDEPESPLPERLVAFELRDRDVRPPEEEDDDDDDVGALLDDDELVDDDDDDDDEPEDEDELEDDEPPPRRDRREGRFAPVTSSPNAVTKQVRRLESRSSFTSPFFSASSSSSVKLRNPKYPSLNDGRLRFMVSLTMDAQSTSRFSRRSAWSDSRSSV